MTTTARSWETAMAECACLAAEGEPGAEDLSALVHSLAVSRAGSLLSVTCWEDHLELFDPEIRTSSGLYLSVIPDTADADHCELLGEDAVDLDLKPGWFLVELRGRSVDESGHTVDAAREMWHLECVDEVKRVIESILPCVVRPSSGSYPEVERP